jgi:hypothetical protein
MNMGVLTESLKQSRGRILGRNWDKSHSHKSFPPCYSQSPPQSTHRVAMADSGVHYVMMENQPWLVRVGGARQPLSLYLQSCSVRSSSEGR